MSVTGCKFPIPRFQMSITGTMSLSETDLIFGSYSQNDFVINDLINSEREVVQQTSILVLTLLLGYDNGRKFSIVRNISGSPNQYLIVIDFIWHSFKF